MRERGVSILLADIKVKLRLQGCQDSIQGIILSREGEIAYKFIISLRVDMGDDVSSHQSRERVDVSHLNFRKVCQVETTITTATIISGGIFIDVSINVGSDPTS